MCTKAEDQSRQRKRSTGSLIIVWLDNIFEDESSFQAISISALQQAGHPVKTFTNIDAFVDFSSDIENGKIIAVVSNEVCQTHLSFIHDLTQIISIFVIYQDNQMKNNERQKDLYKIHSVLNNATEIIDSLKRETKIIEHNLEHISILDCSAYKLDSNHLDYDFMYLHIFKELILEIDYDVEAKYDFIKYCHDYCLHDNPASVRMLEEMYEDYDKHSPILWYTKDTFLYRLVNRSLRDLNAMSIWNLRLFIKDVHQALESQGTIPVTVTTLFRGQRYIQI
jgi:nitrate reductase NapAB chaperone NapD